MKISKHHIGHEEMEQEFQIIELSKQDISNFKPLYDKYYDEIKTSVENILYVNYNIKNSELTKDITSSVFENAILKLSQYKAVSGTPFKSWLYRIMQNEITNYIRKIVTRGEHHKLIQDYYPKYDEINIDRVYPTQEFKLNYLKQYIPRLKVKEQMLIHYRFYEGYSYKQISEITGLTQSNLRTSMVRLLKKIQNYIKNKGA